MSQESILPVCTIFNENQPSIGGADSPFSVNKTTELNSSESEKPPLCNVFGQHSESQERDLFLNALCSTEHDKSTEDLSKTSRHGASEAFDSLALSSLDPIALQSCADFETKITGDIDDHQDLSEEGCLTMNIDSISDETVQEQLGLPLDDENCVENNMVVGNKIEGEKEKESYTSKTTSTIPEEKCEIDILKNDEVSVELAIEPADEVNEVENHFNVESLQNEPLAQKQIKTQEFTSNPIETNVEIETDSENTSACELFSREPTNFKEFSANYTAPNTCKDDPFGHALCSSENDRRKDAWFPSEKTRAILSAIAINQKRIQLESNHITRPGLYTSESLENPSQKLVVQLTGSEDVVKLEQLSANSVPADKHGVRQLVQSGNLRAAVNLCRNLLTEHGQGFGKASQPSINTLDSLQLWFTRISLLLKLNEFDIAKEEIKQFGELDNPDMYYEFYPDLYPGRKGSMVPFSFRVLHADFPNYFGSFKVAINRMHKIVSVCDQVLKNLSLDKTEIGENIKLKTDDKNSSIEFWKKRKADVLTIMGNTLVKMKDFSLAIEIYQKVIEMYPEKSMALHSGIGRLLLQIGDVRGAQQRFALAEQAASPTDKIQLLLNNGFMHAGANNWKEAYSQYSQVLQIDPTNAIAVNNKSVCLLYMGQLKNSVIVLETALTENKTTQNVNKLSHQNTQESLLSNLSTLYELESSRFIVKKRTMFLKHIAPSCTDSFNVACFKEI